MDKTNPRESSTQAAPLALTMGEPGGVGGELTLKAWLALHDAGNNAGLHEGRDKAPALSPSPIFFAIDDPARLSAIAHHLGVDVPIKTIDKPQDAAGVFKTQLPVLPIGAAITARPGIAAPENAPFVINAIEHAVTLALQGAAAGVVTNPIQKASLLSAGFQFPGHTEFLAHLTKDAPMPAGMASTIAGAATRGPVMLLAGEDLMAAPATIHLSLKDAINALSEDLIIELGAVMAASLQYDFNIAAPRIAITGLNPHAGEDGAMGLEDREIIAPAIARLKDAGIDARGPLPADTLFHEEARANYDAALCMYHDQALIPVKALDFHGAVNITLGLPIIRTSPDHGTALDIAGKGTANPDSLIAALRRAAAMTANRAEKSAPFKSAPQKTRPS